MTTFNAAKCFEKAKAVKVSSGTHNFTAHDFPFQDFGTVPVATGYHPPPPVVNLQPANSLRRRLLDPETESGADELVRNTGFYH